MSANTSEITILLSIVQITNNYGWWINLTLAILNRLNISTTKYNSLNKIGKEQSNSVPPSSIIQTPPTKIETPTNLETHTNQPVVSLKGSTCHQVAGRPRRLSVERTVANRTRAFGFFYKTGLVKRLSPLFWHRRRVHRDVAILSKLTAVAAPLANILPLIRFIKMRKEEYEGIAIY